MLIVASHSRRQRIGGQWYHYIADPMADLLEARGIRCLTWQIGAPLTPAYRPYAIISPIIRLAAWWRTGLHTREPLLSPPAWFHEYARVHRELLGSDSSWHEIVLRIRYFMWMSHVMARWIRRSGVHAVMLDCWTNWEMIQAAIAAHRLGLPVMDIQHGIQEHAHHSYHGWRKEPPGGYAIRPDGFWVWGERAEKLYGQTNLIGPEVIRGGNPWLDRWCTNTDPVLAREIAGVREHTRGFRRAILVTTSIPAGKKLFYIRKMIALSPRDWLWFIRLHPSVNRERNAIEQELAELGGERILVEEGTQRPLYALLQVADLHASIESTCAYEAFAFGKPTILIDSSGAMIFREFVASSAMFFAERPEDFGDMAKLALKTDPAVLKKSGTVSLPIEPISTEPLTGSSTSRVPPGVLPRMRQDDTLCHTRSLGLGSFLVSLLGA
ncbi:MAG: hypothetical protein BECKG1743D_GA0114223_102962 [Candidatus Kentron sp. G]|nr:MAG: hypothetical protein BECKG1743F_GA0114225_100152 [Candidatus Kentron sp. G]VFM98389.1 MAG: hypothetical protein BECKG1743E_GA0114224_101883 [Candidatus Kentron sp. G]VFN01623.1 MAG: hypothetical protein BECKG1743D_GA0114223_102962 [Candidatus Kentron sp. G]